MYFRAIFFIVLFLLPFFAFAQKGSLKTIDSLNIINIDSTRIITFWHQFKHKILKKEMNKLADLIIFNEMEGDFGFLLGYKKQKIDSTEFLRNYPLLFTQNVLDDIKKQTFKNFSFFLDYKEKKIVQFSVHLISCKETNGIGGRSLIFLFCSKGNSYKLCAVYAQGGACH